MVELVDRLRATTELMARECSVSIGLWQEHSTAVLEAADALESAALPRQPDLREALEDLLKTAKLLYANSEGCAVNHYGADFEEQGLPGWLDDCVASINRARAALAESEKP